MKVGGLPRSFVGWLALEVSGVLDLSGGLDEFLDYLIVVPVLAVLLVIGGVGEFVDLELRRQFEVVGVDLARSGGEHGVAVLLGPAVEDGREEGRVPQLDLLVVRLYHHLLVQVVLHSVPQHQQVRIDSPQLGRGELAVGEGLLVRQFLALADAVWRCWYMMLYCSTWLE
jgi:hypothetical protein